MKMELLVISNHPPEKWADDQKAGWDVIDYIPFPDVPAAESLEEVIDLSQPIISQIRDWRERHPDGRVSIQGEFTLSAYLLLAVEKLWGWCFSFPTTERQVVEEVKDRGTLRKTVFRFVRWR